MGLNNFVAREPRPLPIFVLADTSGSMRGAKINELNLALRDMINTLNKVDDIRGKFQVSVISFGGSVDVVQELTDISAVKLKELDAKGNTPMGAAFETVMEMIEDHNIVSSRAYTPTIVLISDGQPTDCSEKILEHKKYDEWQELSNLINMGRTSKCQRIALGIGDDADMDMLKAFVNNENIPVVKSKDASGISKFFKWVTMSTIARMNSVNPNDTVTPIPFLDIEDEDIII